MLRIGLSTLQTVSYPLATAVTVTCSNHAVTSFALGHPNASVCQGSGLTAAPAVAYATGAAAVPHQDQSAKKDRSRQLSALRRYGRDLTEEARRGLLDPVIGRQDVIQRTLQVLLRRTKHNPLLIGEAGVGKTAIVEGIAQLVAAPQPLPGLEGKKLIALDVASVVAGSTYRGEFEERLQSLLQDCESAAGSVVLFIDEIHVLVGTGNVEGGLDFANMLKPALARSQLQVIGATTLDEYRQHIETDPALSRRFQPVLVEEPSPQECLELMTGLVPRYETFHRVLITPQAVATAVAAAQRYVPERRLPDSAIDLMDEAAAKLRLSAHFNRQNKRGKPASRECNSSNLDSNSSGSSMQVQIGSDTTSKSSINAGSNSSSSRGQGLGKPSREDQSVQSSELSSLQPGSNPVGKQGTSSATESDQALQTGLTSKQAKHQPRVTDPTQLVGFATDLAGQGIAVEQPAGHVTVSQGVVPKIQSSGMRTTSESTSEVKGSASSSMTVQPLTAYPQQTQQSQAGMIDSQVGAADDADILGGTVEAAVAEAAAHTWSDWITSHGWRGEGEVHKQRLLEWFGSSPAKPLKGAEGHRRITLERRKKHAQLFGPAENATRSAVVKSAEATAPSRRHNDSAVRTNGSFTDNVDTTGRITSIAAPPSSTAAQHPATNIYHQDTDHKLYLHPRSCPHCGALVIAQPEQLKLQCLNCGFRFLNLAPEKLQLGTTVVLEGQQQHALRLLQPLQNTDQQQAQGTLEQQQWHLQSVPLHSQQGPHGVADVAAGQMSSTAAATTDGAGKQVKAMVKQPGPQHGRISQRGEVPSAPVPQDMGWHNSTLYVAANPAMSSSSGLTDRPQVTGQHILEVVSEATGIPVGLLTGSLVDDAAGAARGSQPGVAAGPSGVWGAQQAMLQELSDIHNALTAAILGQDAAAAAIIGAIRLSRLGLHHAPVGGQPYQKQHGPGRPALSLLLTGPSGVGKSSMARVLAGCLMPGEPKGILFLSCGELAERHSISRLVGAPPGYVGYGKGGLLTECIRRHPHCVVVFDDIERAHPDIVGMLFQAVEDGRLMDSLGHNINLHSATMIFTANAAESALATGPSLQAASLLQSSAGQIATGGNPATGQGTLMTGLRTMHSSSSRLSSLGSEGADFDSDTPEPLSAGGTRVSSLTRTQADADTVASSSPAADAAAPAPSGTGASARGAMIADIASRVDDVIQFEPLTKVAMFAIVQQQLQQASFVAGQQGVHLQVNDEAASWIAAAGGSTVGGARGVSQLIRRHVMAPLADAVAGVLAGHHAPTTGPSDNGVAGAVGDSRSQDTAAGMDSVSGSQAGTLGGRSISMDGKQTVWATAEVTLAGHHDATAAEHSPAEVTQFSRPLRLHFKY